MHLTYLLVLLACLAATAPLEIVLRAGVYRRWRRWLAAVLPVAVVFVVWDVLATRAGWWWFDARSVLGPRVLRLPLEEIAFFLVVPTCALLTVGAVYRLRPAWFGPPGTSSRDGR